MTPLNRRAVAICWGLWLRWRAAHGRWGGRQLDRNLLYRLWAFIRAEHDAGGEES
jgi:hypothetical protein